MIEASPFMVSSIHLSYKIKKRWERERERDRKKRDRRKKDRRDAEKGEEMIERG